MGGVLQDCVVELFDRFDALDLDGIGKLFAEEIQGVDEISRGWLRGKGALGEYFATLGEMGVSDVKSSLSDFHTEDYGDTGVVTLMADQTYKVGGEPQSIRAPTTVVLHKTGGEWKIVLVHAVPLPENG